MRILPSPITQILFRFGFMWRPRRQQGVDGGVLQVRRGRRRSDNEGIHVKANRNYSSRQVLWPENIELITQLSSTRSVVHPIYMCTMGKTMRNHIMKW